MLSDEKIIGALRQYVSRNQAIPAFYQAIDENPGEFSDRLEALLSAIHTGDIHAESFSDPDCTSFLLYLIERKKIPAMLGLSAYFHCLALMEFTSKQPLRDEDADLKTDVRMKFLRLVSEGDLTEHGELYYASILRNFSVLSISIDEDDCRAHFKTLPAMDQWLTALCIKRHNKDDTNPRLRFYHAVLENVPMAVKHGQWPGVPADYVTYLLPSLGVYHYCLGKTSEQPVAIKPILGSVSLESLYQLHKNNEHPVGLYHREVKSNIKLVHKVRAGAYITAWHDLAHACWGSLLPLMERQYLVHTLPRFIDGLLDQARAKKDEIVIDRLTQGRSRAYDFDLTPLSAYHDASRRREQVVQSCFGKGGQGRFGIYPKADYKDYRIGQLENDRILYLVCRAYHLNQDPYQIAAYLRLEALKNDAYFRNDGIIALIDSIALRSAKPSAHFSLFQPNVKSERLNINYAAIKGLLDLRMQSKDLWQALRDNHHADLLVLLKSLELTYFEPYAPLNAGDRLKLRAHIDEHYANTPAPEMPTRELACGVL